MKKTEHSIRRKELLTDVEIKNILIMDESKLEFIELVKLEFTDAKTGFTEHDSIIKIVYDKKLLIIYTYRNYYLDVYYDIEKGINKRNIIETILKIPLEEFEITRFKGDEVYKMIDFKKAINVKRYKKIKKYNKKMDLNNKNNVLLPTINMQYKPSAEQWRKITTETDFFAEETTPFTHVELIDFNESKIHIKGGKKIYFDCLSESEYVYVCNGGYFEEATPINEDDRI